LSLAERRSKLHRLYFSLPGNPPSQVAGQPANLRKTVRPIVAGAQAALRRHRVHPCVPRQCTRKDDHGRACTDARAALMKDARRAIKGLRCGGIRPKVSVRTKTRRAREVTTGTGARAPRALLGAGPRSSPAQHPRAGKGVQRAEGGAAVHAPRPCCCCPRHRRRRDILLWDRLRRPQPLVCCLCNPSWILSDPCSSRTPEGEGEAVCVGGWVGV